jgi:23S rRNA G2445 N2-methylase RlmL
MHPLFDPRRFAHGRLLWRHPGSDSARFSPKLAWRMVEAAASQAPPDAVLWDPYCGTGLLPALAALFFHDAFQAVRASDVSAQAVATCRRNLALVTDPDAAAVRRRHAAGLARRNAKSARRWGEIVDYIDTLAPRIARAASASLDLDVQRARPEQLLVGTRPLCIVGDAPYGRSVQLEGPPLEDVIAQLLHTGRVRSLDVTMTPELAAAVARGVPQVRVQTASGGRVRVRWNAGF